MMVRRHHEHRPLMPIITESEFTRRVVRRLDRVAPELRAEAKDALDVRVVDESGARIHCLSRYYDRIGEFGATWSIEEAVRHMRWATHEMTDTSAIIPLIAHRKRLAVAPDDEYVADAIDDDLRIVYGLHLGREARYLRPHEIERLGIPRPYLLLAARGSLEDMTRRIRYDVVDGCHRVVAGGRYESSFMLFDDDWDRGRYPTAGRPVIAVPHRGLLLFSGEDDRAGVRRVRELAEIEYDGAKHPIAPSVFVRSEGRWRRL